MPSGMKFLTFPVRSNFRRTLDRSKITHPGLGAWAAKAKLFFCFQLYLKRCLSDKRKAHLQQMGVVRSSLVYTSTTTSTTTTDWFEIYGHHLKKKKIKNWASPEKKSYFFFFLSHVRSRRSVGFCNSRLCLHKISSHFEKEIGMITLATLITGYLDHWLPIWVDSGYPYWLLFLLGSNIHQESLRQEFC